MGQQEDLSRLRSFDVRRLPPKEAQPTSDGFDRWDAAALGVRGVGSYLSSVGFWPGAIIGGGSEAIAQALEHIGGSGEPSFWDRLGRIGVEAGVSAIPGAGIVKGGKVLKSAARSGALTGLADVGRQMFDDQDYSIGRTIGSAAGGAAIGGLASRFMPKSLQTMTDDVPAPYRYPKPAGPAAPTTDQWIEIEKYQKAAEQAEVDKLERLFKGAMNTADTRFKTLEGLEEGSEAGAVAAQKAQALRDEAEALGHKPAGPSFGEKTVAKVGDTAVSRTNKYIDPDDALQEGEGTEGKLDLVKALFGAGTRASRANPVVTETAQNLDETQREILEAWMRLGERPAQALKNAIRYEAPLREESGRLTKTFVGRSAQQSEGVPAQPGVVEGLTEELGLQVPKVADDFPSPAISSPLEAVAPPIRPETPPPVQSAPVAAPVSPQAPPRPTSGQDAIDQARANFPDEVNAELDRLGSAYRGLPKGDPGKRELGKQMAEIRDFMMGKGRFAAPQQAPPQAQQVASGLAEQGIEAAPRIQPNADEIAAAAKAGRPVGVQADEAQIAELKRALEAAQGSGTTLGAGLGGLQDVLEIAKRHPEFALRALLGLGGAGLGAATSDENPWAGAAVGGAAGFAAPDLFRLVARLPDQVDPQTLKEIGGELYRLIPQYQRASLLATENLPANAFGGPYGASLMAGVELMAAGDPAGLQIIKQMNPVAFLRGMKDSYPEAVERIRHGELGRAENLGEAGGRFATLKEYLSIPATWMTAGDVEARKILEGAGLSEQAARRFTHTSEPELKAFKNVANFPKGSPALQTLVPFARTPANIAEQGMTRAPGLGFIVQAMREAPDPFRQQIVQQLISGGLGYGAYQFGEDNPDSRFLRHLFGNLAGVYALPVQTGIALGQAAGKGRNPLKVALTPRVLEGVTGPLATTQPIADNLAAIARLFGVEGFEDARIPGGIVPRPIAEVTGLNDHSNRLDSLRNSLPSLRNLP